MASIDIADAEGHSPCELQDLGATPFEQLAAREVQSAVQAALQQVPEVFRSAVILRDLEGLSYEEVAEVLDCTVGTVKSRILRGRRALKEILEPLLGGRTAPRQRRGAGGGAPPAAFRQGLAPRAAGGSFCI